MVMKTAKLKLSSFYWQVAMMTGSLLLISGIVLQPLLTR
jgi:hypothetical protein